MTEAGSPECQRIHSGSWTQLGTSCMIISARIRHGGKLFILTSVLSRLKVTAARTAAKVDFWALVKADAGWIQCKRKVVFMHILSRADAGGSEHGESQILRNLYSNGGASVCIWERRLGEAAYIWHGDYIAMHRLFHWDFIILSGPVLLHIFIPFVNIFQMLICWL